MKNIRVFDILWDTTDTGNQDDYSADEVKKLELPTEYVAEVSDDFDPEEGCEISDILSDEFGFCVFSCSYEWVE